jgi:hypothetical protein
MKGSRRLVLPRTSCKLHFSFSLLSLVLLLYLFLYLSVFCYIFNYKMHAFGEPCSSHYCCTASETYFGVRHLHSDVHHYIIIRKLLYSIFRIRWEPTSPYRRSRGRGNVTKTALLRATECSFPICPLWAPAPILSPVGLLGKNLYIH